MCVRRFRLFLFPVCMFRLFLGVSVVFWCGLRFRLSLIPDFGVVRWRGLDCSFPPCSLILLNSLSWEWIGIRLTHFESSMLVWSTVCVCLLDFYMSFTNKFGIVCGVNTLRTNVF